MFFSLSTLEFATKRDMKNALRKLDGSELNGKRIKLVDVSVKADKSLKNKTVLVTPLIAVECDGIIPIGYIHASV